MANASLQPQLQACLQESLDAALDRLDEFATQSDFGLGLNRIFGANSVQWLRSLPSGLERSNRPASMPKLQLRSSTELSGAKAAFSSETQTIYVAEDWLATNLDNPSALTAVLLEELGHWIDAQVNTIDTPGDEGALFSAWVQGRALSEVERSQLMGEDDSITILTEAGPIVAEASLASEANVSFVTQYIDDALDAVLNTLGTAGLNSIALPLIGNLNLASYVGQFVNNTLKQGLINELQAAGNAGTVAVRQALFQALGSSGLNLLLDSDGNNAIDINDILLPNEPNSTEFKFKIGKTFKDSIDLADDLGVAGLDLDVKGKASVNLGVSLDLHFGVDETVGDGSFFLKTSGADELKAQVDINLRDQAGNPLSFDGTLGFLNARVTDNGTQFNAALNADLKTTADPNRVRVSDFGALSITKPSPSAGADLKFKLDTGISTDGTDKNGILPSIQADFEALNALSTRPAIAFKNVTLDAGSFVREFAGGVLDPVKEVTGVIAPVVKILARTDLPVLGSSFVEVAEQQGLLSPDSAKFIKQIADITTLIEAIPSGDQTGKIQLGSFQVTSGNAISQTQAPSQSIADQLLNIGAGPGVRSASGLSSFFTTYNNSSLEGGLSFPLLNDSNNVIKLLLGDPNVNLFTYTTPKLDLGLEFEFPPIPIFGPITMTFEIKSGAGAQMQFGFDSFGLQKFKDGGFSNPELIFDGFYASRPAPDPNILLKGEFTAEAGFNLDFISLGVGGGIRLSNGLSLYNPNYNPSLPPTPSNEQYKVRGSTLSTTDVACLFEANGKLEAFVFAEFEIDLGLFSFSKRLDLANIDLIDIKINPNCGENENDYDQEEDPDKSEEMKEFLAGQGVISYEDLDGWNDISLNDEGDNETGEEIDLELRRSSANQTEIRTYENVKSILIEGRGGNDRIIFSDGVGAFGDVQGGDGDDEIETSGGNDYLNGGQGNDQIDGSTGTDTVYYSDSPNGVTVNLDDEVASNDGYGTRDILFNIENIEGSRFSDRLTGDDEKNVLDGGAGNDILNGLGGDDVFLSGPGADNMHGGGGKDSITYIGSRDHVYINLSNQRVTTFGEFDNLPFSLAANTGYGADADGDRFVSIENVQGTIYDDVLVAGAEGGTIDGFSGNDFIIAGPDEDRLVASAGVDWLSYRLSDAGVSFSLRDDDNDGEVDDSGSGGFADGDEIVLPESKNTKFRERFENLEGSNFDDVFLAGDNFDNVIRGLAGNDVLSGLGGDDILEGGAGGDSIIGGSNSNSLRANTDAITGGGDTATYQNASSAIAVDLQAGLFNLVAGSQGEANGDRLSQIENLIGSDYGDTLIGDSFANDLNPRLSTGRYGETAEVDTVDGGGGRDRLTLIDYDRNDEGDGLSGGFTNFATGSGQIIRGNDVVNFSNIERLLIAGTSYDDELTGGGDRDVFTMGAGNDTVNGGGGEDFLDGDDGIDTLSGDFSFINDSIGLIGDDSKESQIINLSGPGQLLIKRFEIFKNIILGRGNDVLIQKGRVDNIFDTGSGSDTINPGLGIDVVKANFGEFRDDLLIVDYSIGDTGSGITMSKLDFGLYSLARQTGENSGIILDSIRFSGIDKVDITGTQKADQLLGTDGNDKFSSLAGDDNIDAGLGNDMIDGGAGDDFINPGMNGLDQVDGGTEGANGDVLYLDYSQGFTPDDATGISSEVNSDGSSNAGRFYRQRGNGASTSLWDEVKFKNIERFTIIGSRKSDQIQGGNGNDILFGGEGNDTLKGGAGDDVLVGGKEINALDLVTGNDELTGGTGADIFVLGGANSSNLALVTDFSAVEGDRIQLVGNSNQYAFGTAPGAFTGVGIFRGTLNDFNVLVGIVQGPGITQQAVQSSAIFS